MQGVKTLALLLVLASSEIATAAPIHGTPERQTDSTESQAAPPTAQSREKAALALIDFAWQELKYEIVFLPPRVGFRAMIIPSHHRIEVYARPADDSLLVAYDIAHELGHAIDFAYNTKATRAAWMKSRGIKPATPWFGCSRCSDYNTPAGDFAETFALLLLGPGHFAGRIAPSPAMEQETVLAAFFPKGTIRARLDSTSVVSRK